MVEGGINEGLTDQPPRLHQRPLHPVHLPATQTNKIAIKENSFLLATTRKSESGPTSRAFATGNATVSDSARAGSVGSGDTSPANAVSDTTAAAASPPAACPSARPPFSVPEPLPTATGSGGGGCSRLADCTRSLALPAARTAGRGGAFRTRPGSGRGARVAVREHSTISMDATPAGGNGEKSELFSVARGGTGVQVDTGDVHENLSGCAFFSWSSSRALGQWTGGDPCEGIFPSVHVAGAGSHTYLRRVRPPAFGWWCAATGVCCIAGGGHSGLPKTPKYAKGTIA